MRLSGAHPYQNLKRELVRAQEEVKRIQSVPLTIGSFSEMVDEAHGVVQATFPVDIHALTAEENKKAGYGNAGVRMKPYDIPLRALVARDVDGLLMAGRCISGDFIAHASYRVTGNAVAMGEAAGAVAAIAAATKRRPHEVSWEEGRLAVDRARDVGRETMPGPG
jgi:hypothetical protein